MKYIGTATSHFQAEPWLGLGHREPLIANSDWEWEIKKNIEDGNLSLFKEKLKSECFPTFLDKKSSYVSRSRMIGMNMFRFSVDFGRLCPGHNEFNFHLMDEYMELLALIRLSGQEPMLTFHHYTMPVFLKQAGRKSGYISGAWENPDVIEQFQFFIRKVMEAVTDRKRIAKILYDIGASGQEVESITEQGLVKYFMTFNEPVMTPVMGYLTGAFPPFKKFSPIKAKKVLNRMVEAHKSSTEIIRFMTYALPKDRQPRIGVGYNWQCIEGLGSALSHYVSNEWYTAKFERAAPSDYLGLQYYFRTKLPFFWKKDPGADYSDNPDFGEIYPEGIGKVLEKMHTSYPRTPIFVSEIGFSDYKDTRRPFWLNQTMYQIAKAEGDGIPIEGVLLWSLVDNFEWTRGMSQKFGLFSEYELGKPLIQEPGRIRSWQIWQAWAGQITGRQHLSSEYLGKLFESARVQYLRAKGQSKNHEL